MAVEAAMATEAVEAEVEAVSNDGKQVVMAVRGECSSLACINLQYFCLVSNCIMFGFDVAGRALGGAVRHLDLFGLPINLQVMVIKPVVPQDYALLTQMSDCELSML
jgi:hypothetical protein